MLDFVRKAFRGGLEVILWINLILSTIGGGIAGYYLGQLISYRNADGYAFVGVLIGIIFGLLTNIVGGGFIATILNMDKNLEKLIKENLSLSSDEGFTSENVDISSEKPIVGGKYIFIESDILRKGPGDHHLFVYRYNKDEIAEIKQIDDNWSLVRVGDVEGWCLSSALKRIDK
jgi:hypothetical protein